MADQASRGRARGRGRGQQQPTPAPTEQMGQMTVGETQSESGNGNGNGDGNGNGAAMRGRGGYRRFDPVTRPVNASLGNKGQQVTLFANYFKLMQNPNLHLFQYHVTFEPPEIDRRIKRKMIYNHAADFNETFIYDGDATIFALSDSGEENEYLEQAENVTVKVIVKRIKEITDRDNEASVEMIRVFNTQMRTFMGRYLKLVRIRQYLYSAQNKIDIPEHHISVWPGTLTAINKHFGGYLCCCDPIYKVVRTDNVLTLLKKLREENPQRFKEEAIAQLVSTPVMTNYNNRTYRIDDIDWNTRPWNNMPMRPGEQPRTYIEYYKERYNLQIRDLNQPLLIARPSVIGVNRGEAAPQILLIPEVCLMTGLSESMMNDFQLKKAMGEHTRPVPSQRVAVIKRFMQSLNANADVQRDLNTWGCKYDTNLLQLHGRILPHEAILTRGEDRFVYDHRTDDFIAQIRSKPLRSCPPLHKWIIFATERDREHVDTLQNTMKRVCQGMAMDVRRPEVRLLPNPSTRAFVEECKKVDPKNTDMVVVICPDNKADRYSALKKLFCCDMAVLSQIVLSRNVRSKGFMSICTKIALQIACKLGGEGWCCDIPAKGIMVVGFDTYHDTQATGAARRSVGGFVSSLNPSLSKWFSRVNFHQTAEELSQHFVANMTSALREYHKVNKRMPEWVVVYRDGVGEGQIGHVFETEKADIAKAIAKEHSATQLTFIVVSKRINTRLFRAGQKQGEYLNPYPGTVVDTVITRPTRYDFYLVSQSVRQGTVAPTNFNIIHDDSNKTANVHQMLAYKMTHMYYNWPGTIRVPAPCQYAHKLAFLTGTALHREPHQALSNYLYYL